MRVNIGGTWTRLEALDKLPVHSEEEMDRDAIQFIREWQEGRTSFTFHTSGSTGDPKPISFHRDQLVASAQLTLKVLPLTPGMTALVCLDPRFVAGAMMIVRCLVGSIDMVIRPASSNPFTKLPEPIDFAALVPLQVTTVLKESPAVLDALKVLIVGGAPLPETVVSKLKDCHAHCYATYGMTETLTHIALRKLNGPDKQSAFHLLPGIHASLNELGCLVIEAPHLGPPIVTHDIAEWTGHDSFRILGRSDEVINSGGVKVHPKKVEAILERVLDELGYTFRFFIAGQPDERLGQHVCLFIEGPPLSEAAESAMLSHLNQWLSTYERPRQVVFCRSFVHTPTQKIDRYATMLRSIPKK
ncbi:MAG: AMP-binding protein [Cyclobacteriaceae bacterium]|nr:AMP-binding protein [Cyclobacteriaceae bacterium]